MAMFVLVTKLNDSLIATANQRKTAGSHWLKKVKELCPDVRWKAHYALLGRYDFWTFMRRTTSKPHKKSLS